MIFSPLHLHLNKNKLLNTIGKLRGNINKFLHPALYRDLLCRINGNFGLQLKQNKYTENVVNEEKGKSRCSDGERALKCDYFILQFYHLLHKLMLYSICSLAPNRATSISGCRPPLYRVKKIERTTLKVIVSLSFISYLFVYLVYLNFFKLHSLINSSYNVHSRCTKLTQDSVPYIGLLVSSYFFIRVQNVKLSKDLKVLFLSFKNFRLNINASSKALNKCTTIC